MSVRRVGRYLMLDRIAAGGMAVVHIGRLIGPAGFARTVAIKRLHEHLSGDPEFTSMFLDEARLAACVQHPNVVATLDIVRDQGDLFLVMDYVLGESLSSLIAEARQKREPIPLRIVSSVVIGVLSGLHAAHEARTDRGEPMNIVHRDVSPPNVLVGADGVARVVDFGIAKAAARMHATEDGKLKGKIAYMAPEQLKRADVDRRADLYAAGVVLWEMTTGSRLFSADDHAGIVTAVLAGAPEDLSTHRREVPRALDRIMRIALAVDPAARYATALEFVADLEAAVAPAPAREVAAWVAAVAGPKLAERRKLAEEIPTMSDAIAIVDRPPPPVRPAKPARRALLPSIALGALSVVAVAVFASVRYGAGPREMTPVPAAVAEPVTAPGLSSSLPDPAGGVASPDPEDPSADPGAGSSISVEDLPPHRTNKPPRAKRPTPAGCNPPFVLDENGVKRFKPSCF
jgi:hypothetical protein